MSHAPIRQLAPRIRGRLDVIVEIVNRAAHVYDWELPRRVGGTPEAAELSVPTSSVIIDWDTAGQGKRLTFSSIFASGPPPPSPLPKTRSDDELDSRFYPYDGHQISKSRG